MLFDASIATEWSYDRMKNTALAFAMALLVATSRAHSAGAAAETPPARVPILLLAGEGAPSGLTGRLKLSADKTAGAYGLIERINAKVEGPNPHTHSHLEEAWYVIEGELLFQSKDTQFRAGPGTFVLVPSGVDHRFWADPGKTPTYLLIVTPGGFTNFFQERLTLPGRDPNKTFAAQSPEFRKSMDDLAARYGAGPSEHPSDSPPVVVPPSKSGVGTSSRLLADRERTHGGYVLVESGARGNRRDAKKSSDDDQAWYLLAGELSFVVDSKKLVAPVGACVFIPRGNAYRYWSSSKVTPRYLLITSRG
jgi:mannose-6-phosphate isomerase-like protein (cupin superfamily)